MQKHKFTANGVSGYVSRYNIENAFKVLVKSDEFQKSLRKLGIDFAFENVLYDMEQVIVDLINEVSQDDTFSYLCYERDYGRRDKEVRPITVGEKSYYMRGVDDLFEYWIDTQEE